MVGSFTWMMRWIACLTATCSVTVVSGQSHLACDGPPNCQLACDAPPPTPRHVYICPCPTCKARGGEPESAPQPSAQSAPGAFIAPPQTGVQVGSSRQTSIGGFAIRLPEIRIGFPSIELPCRVTRTRGGHMELDSAIADFRSYPAQPANYFGYRTAPAATLERAAEAAPASTDECSVDSDVDEMRKRCEVMAEQLRRKEALLDGKLSELEAQLQRLRCVPAEAAGYPAAATSTEGAQRSAPTGVTPASFEYTSPSPRPALPRRLPSPKVLRWSSIDGPAE